MGGLLRAGPFAAYPAVHANLAPLIIGFIELIRSVLRARKAAN
jgi:hypothetical protein